MGDDRPGGGDVGRGQWIGRLMPEVDRQKQTDGEVVDDGWIVGRRRCIGLVGGQAMAKWTRGRMDG